MTMLCVSLKARDNQEMISKMAQASPLAEYLELRLDTMEGFDLGSLLKQTAIPLIVTYRSRKEGGQGTAPYQIQAKLLMEAMEQGADFVDLEFSMPLEYREAVLRKKAKGKIIVSKHILNSTPHTKVLEELLMKMAATGADLVKIVTRAISLEDNLRVLNLIPTARRLGVQIIAFCMGKKGRISRIACVPLGAPFTYVSLNENEETAEGQISLKGMRQIFKELGFEY